MTGGLHIILAAGGTGGHMMPADVLAGELRARGHQVSFVTDDRGARLPDLFEGGERLVLQAKPNAGLVGRVRFLAGLLAGVFTVRKQFRQWQPDLVLGFGGYPSAPAMIAARLSGLPTMLHEQNAILGRTNRMVAGKASMIATSFEGTARLPDGVPVTLTGLPVRPEIREITPLEMSGNDQKTGLLVIGGSQGARILSDVVPAAIVSLPESLRSQLKITHQARPEDLDRARQIYSEAGVDAEVASYYTDIPSRLAECSLMIARAGASTIAELTAAGRASILVPLGIAMDDHQSANARTVGDGCHVMTEAEFEAGALEAVLEEWLSEPANLVKRAQAARNAGKPDACERLADLVEQVAGMTAGQDKAA